MDRKQADAIAQAILAPDSQARDALVRKRAEETEKLARQRRHAWFGLAGFAVGAAIGHFAFGSAASGGLIGLFVGTLVGVWAGRIPKAFPTSQT